MSHVFAYYVKELVEDRVRTLIRRGYTDNEILQEAHCRIRVIDEIRKEEERKIKEFEEAEESS